MSSIIDNYEIQYIYIFAMRNQYIDELLLNQTLIFNTI